MALTLVKDIGGTTSNVYEDEVAADTYFEGRLYNEAWTGASTEDKKRALVNATNRIDMVEFEGARANHEIQRLKWPRQDAVDIDGFVVLTTEIPREIIEAMYEMALVMLETNIQEHTELDRFDSLRVGNLSLTPNHDNENMLPDEVARLLQPFFLRTNARLIRG